MASIIVGLPLIALALTAVVSLFVSTISLRLVLLAIGALVIAYFSMAIMAAAVVFLLRPLRKSGVGWALTGAIIAPGCYALLATTLSLFEPVGLWLFAAKGGEPLQPGELPGVLTVLVVLAVPIGAAAGLYWRAKPL
jgi:hypothetical protein